MFVHQRQFQKKKSKKERKKDKKKIYIYIYIQEEFATKPKRYDHVQTEATVQEYDMDCCQT